MEIIGLDHVQLAMPPGREDDARAFYGEVLGLVEVPKRGALAARGGVWFGGAVRASTSAPRKDSDRPTRRIHTEDLFGNRMEIIADGEGFSQR